MKNIYIILSIIVLATLAFLFVGCEPHKGEPVVATIDRTGQPIEVVVFFYDNINEVTRVYREKHNLPRNAEMPRPLGFAMWPEWFDEDGNRVEQPELFRCEIHTIRPTHVDDDPTLTLGHELLHCLYGSYHKHP